MPCAGVDFQAGALAVTYVGNGPESHRIIPPTIRTQNIESMELQAAELEAEAEARLCYSRESSVESCPPAQTDKPEDAHPAETV